MTLSNLFMIVSVWVLLLSSDLTRSFAGPYAPAADQPGSTAVHQDSSCFVDWAASYVSLVRGFADISNPSNGLATFGSASNALGKAVGDSFDVVSLGDGGSITLTFNWPIANGEGPDFAVFENGFSDTFLELAFVGVSSDGVHYERFPSVSLTQTNTQVSGFGTLDPTDIYNLAGKYRQGYGTPFDLETLKDRPLLNVSNVTHVRLVDVVGSLDAAYATVDSQDRRVNDPWPTSFASSGFDLDAVGVMHALVYGVPTAWLAAYTNAAQPTHEQAALADPDGDGHSTWQEYHAGTNPTAASSVLHVAVTGVAPNGRAVFRWPSVTGRLYSVHTSSRLTNSFVAVDQCAATPPMNVYTAGPEKRLFFSVSVRVRP